MTEATETARPAATVEVSSRPSGVPDLDPLVRRLLHEYPTVDEEQISTTVRMVAAGYRDARILQYVAIFIEREVRESLRSAGVPRPRSARPDERAGP